MGNYEFNILCFVSYRSADDSAHRTGSSIVYILLLQDVLEKVGKGSFRVSQQIFSSNINYEITVFIYIYLLSKHMRHAIQLPKMRISNDDQPSLTDD
jgi:hypothetical protein